LPLKAIGEDCLSFVWPSGRELRLRKPANPADSQFKTGQGYKLLLRPEKIEFAKQEGRIRLFSAKLLSYRFAGAWSEWEAEGEDSHGTHPAAFEWRAEVGMTLDLWVQAEGIQSWKRKVSLF
jgi:hypothetical protein